MKLPLVTGQQMIKILSLKGFVSVRQRSSHVQLKNDKGVLVTVSVHGNKLVSTGLTGKILRDAEITREEYVELVKKV